jgi:hypothetical protein
MSPAISEMLKAMEVLTNDIANEIMTAKTAENQDGVVGSISVVMPAIDKLATFGSAIVSLHTLRRR